MRKLMWFTIGFAVACGLCAYGSGSAWIFPGILGAMLAGCTMMFRNRHLLRRMMATAAGCLVGFGWFFCYSYVYLRPVAALDGQTAALTITATDFIRETDYGYSLDGVTSIDGKPYQLIVYLEEEMQLHPGDKLKGSFRLRLTFPDGREDSTWYQGKGVFLLADQQEAVSVIPAETIPRWCFPAVLRREITGILESVFPPEISPFAKALLLGDSRDLDYEIDTAFKVSGIRHIIAVSGLHISVLYGLICTVTLKNRYLTALAGMPLLLVFAAVAGFTPSVTRACIMVWLMLIAMIFDREYDPPTALSFAVLVMLICNPLAVTSVSLQLSAGCVAGILLFNGSINRWLKEKLPGKKGMASRFRGMLGSSISVTLSAMSLTTPLSAYYFGMVSLVGILTNLLTFWAVNLVFGGLILVCIVHLLTPAGAGMLAQLLCWPVRYIFLVAKTLSSVPMAAVYTKSIYIVLWLVFVYLLLTVWFCMKKKQPGKLLCCGVIGLCLALLASWAEPLTAGVQITMLDVGQGQSLILHSEGKTFLVDCGGDHDERTADTIAHTLLSRGIHRLDGIILTHYDRDHSGAISYLLTRIETDLLILPDTRNTLDIPETEGEILYVWEDMELSFGEAKLMVYGPVYSGQSNENSLCVLFDTENCDILITGDRSSFGERMLLRGRELPDVDILVAGHHGAGDATSRELLDAVKPETVLISVSENNIYGHPAKSLLQRLDAFGCTVYRTDQHGSITIRR